MNTTYRKNLKDVAVACKNYTDKKIDDLKWELGSHTLDVESDTTTACTKTVPSDVIGCQINKLGGMSYKSINIWDEQWEQGGYDDNGGTTSIQAIRSKNYISILPNTDYYFRMPNITNVTTRRLFYTINKELISSTSYPTIGAFTTPNNAYYMKFNTSTGYGTTYNNDICINLSNSVNGTYKPYIQPITKQIPAEVQALEGYGWGVNDTCYNYIDYDTTRKKWFYVQKVGRVDLGTLDYDYISDGTYPYFRSSAINSLVKIPADNYTLANVVCSSLEIQKAVDIRNNGLLGIAIDNSGYIRVATANMGTNPTTFKTAMDGVYLYYELATPVETDISEYIDNNFIEVEENGTLTFTNTYNQAVPSEIDYLIEEVKA